MDLSDLLFLVYLKNRVFWHIHEAADAAIVGAKHAKCESDQADGDNRNHVEAVATAWVRTYFDLSDRDFADWVVAWSVARHCSHAEGESFYYCTVGACLVCRDFEWGLVLVNRLVEV